MKDGTTPCALMRTLRMVTETFLGSVNQVPQVDDNHMDEYKKMMQNFENVCTVVRVLSLAFPIDKESLKLLGAGPLSTIVNAVNNKSPSPVQENTHKEQLQQEDQAVQPKQQQPLQPTKQQQLQPKQQQLQPTKQTNQKVAHPTTASPPFISTVVEPKVAYILRAENKSVVKKETVPQEVVESRPTRASSPTYIPPKVFLDQFEITATELAAKENVRVSTVWEQLLNYALPPNKLQWAKSHVFNRNLTLAQFRQMYLVAFSDDQKPFRKVPSSNSRPRDNQRPGARTHDPLPTPPPNDEEELQMLRSRQEKYAEHFLALEMKEYQTIQDYNKKYLSYAKTANIDLDSQSDSMRRYVKSLLPKHKSIIDSAVQSRRVPHPKNIKEIMDLAQRLIEQQRLAKEHIYAQPCWKHPSLTSSLKRSSDELSNERPVKRAPFST